MGYPTEKSLSQIKDCDTKLVRSILVSQTFAELADIRANHPGKFDATDKWISSCYNHPSFHDVKMNMLDVALNTFGVEYIRRGHNQKSPAIEYCNTGDTYATTLLYIRGTYRVGDWGSIVERGNYD